MSGTRTQIPIGGPRVRTSPEGSGGAGVKLRRLQHVSSPYPHGKQDEVRAFYGALLGLKEVPVPHTLAHRELVWFSAGSDGLEMHFFPGAPDREHPRHFCLDIEDLQAVRSQLVAAGYEPYDGTPIPNRPRFFCRDPFGNLMEFTTVLGDYRQQPTGKK
jgi:catechol 2,3-dioxygenase-like lactoylglutathione lyase family enzyme